ncbi:MAG: outer membrane protein assembly factor BamA [Desulfobacterales bacterium]|jgi:outer membrane protein insertion porin family|nr:outer membrane protein assembly factor BamA [Desulfobacterales bacterium]
MRKYAGICFVLAFCLHAGMAFAEIAETVKDVRVTGNERIESDAILRVVQTRQGAPYDPALLSEDLKAIYAMGYFDDIRVSLEREPDGNIVIYDVKEKPTIREINISGNSALDDEKITENIDITSGSILNIFKIQKNIRIIESLYKEKNYHHVAVTYKIDPLEHNQADLEFIIEEGEKVRIKEIRFDGNTAFESEKLKKMMETSEKGFFSWLTGSGELNMEKLNQDIVKINSSYQNSGYADARVGEPEVTYSDEWIYIVIKIDEGDKYQMGNVGIAGDLVVSAEEMLSKLTCNKEPTFNRDAIRQDVLSLTDINADKGFARAEVVPEIDKDVDNLIINIMFHIKKNQPVYFEKINIQGNTKTRDKVIRRELEVFERELYSSTGMKESMKNLNRLDFFEDVNIRTLDGSAEDQTVLQLEIKEKPTGTFSFGGGYSGVDKLYVMAAVAERNFLGKGQDLQFKVQTGSVSRQYSLSFTEPWLFDIPLSAGVDLYQWNREYDDYDREATGGGVRFGYPIFKLTRGYISYNYDDSYIDDIDEDASEYIEQGSYTESSVSVSTVYDSRNRMFNPTEGASHKATVQYAGIGGNVGFTKITAETGWYYPLFWSTVGFLHAESGYVWENKYLPDYDRFYLGGINSLRGFDWREVSPVDENGYEYGGDRYIQFNVEYLFPIIKDAGFMGLLFYDTGNAFDGGPLDLTELRETAGGGIRWYSPMGPLRLEHGTILDRKPGEDSGRWEFSIGGFF